MNVIYTAARNALLTAGIDFDNDTIKMALTGEDFAFDDTHTYVADVTGLLGPVVNVNVTSVANSRVLISDVTFNDVAGSEAVRGLLAFKDTGDPATDLLVCAIDGRADTVPLDIIPNGGDLTFSFNYLVKI